MTDDNWQLADELLNLIHQSSTLYKRAKDLERADPIYLATIRATRINERRQSEIQDILSERFGAAYGWRPSRSQFSLPCLARGGHHDGTWQQSTFFQRETTDHPYFYRSNRRAAAIAAHLYNWPNCEPACRKLAANCGCDVREITDFPSWWYPGSTTLVLWTGAVHREAADSPSRDCHAMPLGHKAL